jgi:hypothetical protein
VARQLPKRLPVGDPRRRPSDANPRLALATAGDAWPITAEGTERLICMVAQRSWRDRQPSRSTVRRAHRSPTMASQTWPSGQPETCRSVRDPCNARRGSGLAGHLRAGGRFRRLAVAQVWRWPGRTGQITREGLPRGRRPAARGRSRWDGALGVGLMACPEERTALGHRDAHRSRWRRQGGSRAITDKYVAIPTTRWARLRRSGGEGAR